MKVISDGGIIPVAGDPDVAVTRTDRARALTDRLSTLVNRCLARDHYKCVVTGAFHKPELVDRLRSNPGAQLTDEDGQPIVKRLSVRLQVAHIIPHSLMAVPSGSSQASARTPGYSKNTPSFRSKGSRKSTTSSRKSTSSVPSLTLRKKVAISLLQMFRSGILELINGPLINQPTNTISLTADVHDWFGGFEIAFERADPSVPDFYFVRAFNELAIDWLGELARDQAAKRGVAPGPGVEVTVKFNSTSDAPAPSSELLGLHHAIARMMHLSAAVGYVPDKTTRDAERVRVLADEWANLGESSTSSKIQSWLEGLRV